MDLKQSVIQKLNQELGNDLKNINNWYALRDKLMEDKINIEKSLSLASSEVPSKVSAAIRGVEEISSEINRVTSEFDNLSCSVNNQLMKVEGTTNQLEEYIDKINQLERSIAYLHWIKKIEDLSAGLEVSLSEKDDQKGVELFVELCDLSKQLQSSACHHLITFLRDTIHFWHNLLKDKFSMEFEEILKAVKWPFVSSNSVLAAAPPPGTLQRFQVLTEHLLQLQLPDALVTHPDVTSVLLTEFAPLTLPLTLLLRPLRKRFLFHFYGTKQTNRADKPEWFFTQILTWIRDHEKFVTQWVQPVLNKLNMVRISAKLELMRGLVQIVVEKLHSELPHLQYEDALFSHTVDETLGFDRELRDSYSYPTTQPSVISVLTQAQIFVKWIHMEKKYASEKIDSMLSSETAWLPLGTAELDELKITECGESFLTLLLTMTERYSSLPQPGHRLQFLELQLDLLDDFRVRLLQLLHEEPPDPLNSRLPAIVNTINYISSVLQEWGGLTHFLHLQYYKAQFGSVGTECDSVVVDDVDVAGMQGTVFDEILDLLHHMKDELMDQLCETVMLDVMARSREYRNDKWYAMPSPKEWVNPSVTPSACPMFQVLATKLHQLQELLSLPLFTQAWQKLANELSQFIYEEVLLQNCFNEGGAMQLQYDMTRNLFPLFGQFTHKPDAHFSQVKEACLLLNLPKGSGLLLMETLSSCCNADRSEGIQEAEVLGEVGIHQFNAEKTIFILKLRTDLAMLL